MPTIILLPTGGRKYDSKDAVLSDWEENIDFQNVSTFQHYRGDYVCKKDFHDLGVDFKFYYDDLKQYFYL